jgi:uncharacterized membrane protein YfcA
MDRRTFAGTSARFYVVFNTLRIPLYASPSLEILSWDALKKSLWLMPLVPLTVRLGSHLNRRLSPADFNKIIYALLALSGGYLIYTQIRR